MAGAALTVVPRLSGAKTNYSADERKQALLDWAREDAAAEDAAGRAANAAAIRTDLNTSGSGEAAKIAANLFQQIPQLDRNPYLTDALKRVAQFRDSAVRYPKGEAGNIVHSDTEGWRFINISTQALELTSALCHPDSPMAGDPRLIAPMLRRFATVYEYLTPGAKNLADFGISPWIAEMYYLLHSTYPGLILPSYKSWWEKAIEVNSDAIAAKYGSVFLEGKEGTAYPNAHTHYINALLFASLILNRPDYRKMAEAGVKLMATCQYPDGGNAYIGYQNECFTYHPIAVKDMARYWQVTGNQLAYDLAAKTRWYCPLSVEPGGVAEYSMAPSWKPYWNMVYGTDGAALAAALNKCPHNLRIAREHPPEGTFWLASFYRDDFQPAPVPDQYITYDRNTEGPRGRFGAWSFSGTSRDYHDDPRGKLTYVGAMALGEKRSPKWPLSAALHAAGAEVRFKAAESGTNRWDTHFCLARQERNASAVHKDFASITTSHRLSIYNGPATDWAVSQQWLFTRERIVGMVTLEALAELKAYSIGGAVQLLCGRGNWGVRKTFDTIDANTLKYGALFIRFHDHDTGLIQTEYTDVFSGNSQMSGRIVLADREPELRMYPKGSRTRFLLEIHPDWVQPAKSVSVLTDGLELVESNQRFRLIHNPTDTPTDVSPTNARIWRSGQNYRSPWLEEAPIPTEMPSAQAKETIPPHSHVVLSESISI